MSELSSLYRKLETHFTSQELDVMLMNMDINPLNVPGAGSIESLRVRQVVNAVNRMERIPDLIDQAKQMRPGVSFYIYDEEEGPEDELVDLLVQLQEFADSTMENHPELSEVAQKAHQLGDELVTTKDTKKMVITAEGLKRAAENLSEVFPTVLAIAIQIVEIVSRLK